MRLSNTACTRCMTNKRPWAFQRRTRERSRVQRGWIAKEMSNLIKCDLATSRKTVSLCTYVLQMLSSYSQPPPCLALEVQGINYESEGHSLHDLDFMTITLYVYGMPSFFSHVGPIHPIVSFERSGSKHHDRVRSLHTPRRQAVPFRRNPGGQVSGGWLLLEQKLFEAQVRTEETIEGLHALHLAEHQLSARGHQSLAFDGERWQLRIDVGRWERTKWLQRDARTYYSALNPAFIDDENGTRITLQKYHPRVEDKISIEFKSGFDFHQWHHYCFVFQSFPNLRYLGGRLNLTTKTYFDGVFIREGEDRGYEGRSEGLSLGCVSEVHATQQFILSIQTRGNVISVNRAGNQSDYVTIEQGADIVLGQKLEAGKKFDVRKSFAGRMSQVRASEIAQP